MTNTPLDGIRVVELSERGSAAYAGKVLRRLGAEVLKLEPPGGEALRWTQSPVHRGDAGATTPAFDYFAEGKTVRTVTDADSLRQAMQGSDAFVLDLLPATYGRYGLDAETLAELDCRVVCAITPFGLTGPYRDFLGGEIVTSAFGGMSVGIGEPGRPPLKIPMIQGAVQAGLVGAIAVMGSLFDAPTDAGAAVIDISETDVWATVHAGTTMVAFLFSNRMRRREGRRVVGQPYPHGLFRCKDGWMAIQASERHQWDQFVEMVGAPDFLTDRRFGSRMEMNFRHANELNTLLAPWFAERTRAEIFVECRRRRIPGAPVRSMSEVRADPDLAQIGAFESYTGASGARVTVPSPPFRFRHAQLAKPGDVESAPS
jgi:crotonobetainyl-CoA:carnitine CoA-transferase CaiB-like acyl-CoA transferase